MHDTISTAERQIGLEGQSSHTYLTMAVWAETQGFDGVAEFLYAHSEKERQHMLKLMRFVNERGAVAQVPSVHAGATEYTGLKEVFESILAHETKVTECINNVVDLCLQAKDYTTHNFMQWYVSEQIEEEALARRFWTNSHWRRRSRALYLFDRDIVTFGASEGVTMTGVRSQRSAQVWAEADGCLVDPVGDRCNVASGVGDVDLGRSRRNARRQT